MGAGAGFTTNSSDLPEAEYKMAFGGSADLYFSRYINAGIEIQAGKLSGKENRNTARYFENEYKSVTAYGKVHAGALYPTGRYHFNDDGFFDRLVKGIYFGTGGGMLISKQVSINRNALPGAVYAYRGVNNNKELFIPLLTGLDLYTSREGRLVLSLQYQSNFVLGDNMDGYFISGSKNDIFSTLSLGFKFTFGSLQPY